MKNTKATTLSQPLTKKFHVDDYLSSFGEKYGTYGIVSAAIAAVIVPILLSSIMGKKKGKKRGVPLEVGGETGYAVRNARTTELLQFPWEGATTIAELFDQCCKKYSRNHYLGTRRVIKKDFVTASDGRKFEKLHLGDYEWQTYGEVYQRACHFASGLVNFGHDVDTRIAIFSETRAEWQIALQGCLRQNITVVTIYASLGEDALIHSLNETQVTTLICESKQLKKLAAIRPSLETISSIIYFEDNEAANISGVFGSISSLSVSSFHEVELLGERAPVPPSLPSKDNIAVIMYTSGSTGLPKGVMITHGNIVALAAAVLTVIPGIGKNDVYLAYLPLAHVLELAAESVMLTAGCAIGYGSPLTLTDTSSKIMRGTKGDASVLRPTLMAAVPAILDRVRDGVLKKVEEKGGLARKLFDIAYKRRLQSIEGSWFGAWGLERWLWDVIVFERVRAALGGRLRLMLSGGAPLSANSQRFINICMGAPVCQGYGLTETCAGSAFTEWDDTTIGRVGPPVPCCYLKLVNWEEGRYSISDKPMPRGEIVVGGHSVTHGYFNNPEKTDEVYKVDERGMRWFLDPQQKVQLVLYHVIPKYYSLNDLQFVSNPVRTQAGEDFGLNVTGLNNQVNVSSGVVETQINNALYQKKPLAIYQADKVLLPEEFFEAKSPAAAPSPATKKSSTGSKSNSRASATADEPASADNSGSTGRNMGLGFVVGLALACIGFLS